MENSTDRNGKHPKVSIIIPTYNCEKYINETIDSVLNQTLKEIEVIIVDDGSTDRTRDIVNSYGAPVRLITQKNSGVCSARNRGIRESAGEYICLMDHDDYWFPDKLSLQLRQFQQHPEVGIVYSKFINWGVGEDGKFPSPSSFERKASEDEIDQNLSGWIYHQFLLDCWMLTSSAIFRADVFRQCGVFDESLPYSEDWDLWLRISREYPFICLTRPTTLYRQHVQQGNRVLRDTDYRTELLENSVKKWGLSSRDGRSISRRRFHDQLAAYHAGFGLMHLQYGKRSTFIRSLMSAWSYAPQNLKYLAYILASMVGWKPKW